MAPRYDPDRDGFDIENLPPHDGADDAWDEDGTVRPLTETADQRATRLAREAARRADVAAEISDLRLTIEDRRLHGATEADLNADRARLMALEGQFELGGPYELIDEEPILVDPAPTKTRSDPLADFHRALGTELSDEERDLLDALRREETQASISALLGISQGAVSKREDRLRTKVNRIHRSFFGTDYPIIDRSRIPGRQGRRRKAKE